nr:MMPL family transporter [uncultured Blautia sp.]
MVLAPICYNIQKKNDFLYGGSRIYSTNETQMGRDLLSIEEEYGASIPDGFVPSQSLSKLYSDHYNRFVVTLNTEESDSEWKAKLENPYDICEDYYGDEALIAGDLASTKDLQDTITQDNERVNLLAIGFVFVILLFNFKSLLLPVHSSCLMARKVQSMVYRL